jgi:hypothetical protein
MHDRAVSTELPMQIHTQEGPESEHQSAVGDHGFWPDLQSGGGALEALAQRWQPAAPCDLAGPADERLGASTDVLTKMAIAICN